MTEKEQGMIIDTIGHLERYFPIDARLHVVAEALETLPPDIADGRYPLSGDVTMLIQVRETAQLSQGLFETHERFIDVQVILEGEEVLSFADTKDLTEAQGYDAGEGHRTVFRRGRSRP